VVVVLVAAAAAARLNRSNQNHVVYTRLQATCVVEIGTNSVQQAVGCLRRCYIAWCFVYTCCVISNIRWHLHKAVAMNCAIRGRRQRLLLLLIVMSWCWIHACSIQSASATSTVHYMTNSLFMGMNNKKLSCHREAARRFTSLEILSSHSRSLKVIRNYIVE